MTIYPNPKINIGLSVVRKRADGYHDIETLFYPYFGVHDELTIEPAAELKVDIAPCTWDPMSDLTVRAWKLLHDDFGIAPVHIYLEKNIPVGAGLGGGSADAAFALKAMNTMFGLGLDDAALASYAARLGSDCAFFIYNRPMLGSGRGEVLESIDGLDLSAYDLRVETPEGVHVSTREAYDGVIPREAAAVCGSAAGRNAAGKGESFIATAAPLPLRQALALPVGQWRAALVNDFEPSVFRHHDAIRALKDRFYSEGAIYASMTGSGSSVFGLFPKK